nr:hypothetical protein [Aliihoeflea sp. 40Bstr573]
MVEFLHPLRHGGALGFHDTVERADLGVAGTDDEDARLPALGDIESHPGERAPERGRAVRLLPGAPDSFLGGGEIYARALGRRPAARARRGLRRFRRRRQDVGDVGATHSPQLRSNRRRAAGVGQGLAEIMLDRPRDRFQLPERKGVVDRPAIRPDMRNHEVEMLVGRSPGPGFAIVLPEHERMVLGPESPEDPLNGLVALFRRQPAHRRQGDMMAGDGRPRPVAQGLHVAQGVV